MWSRTKHHSLVLLKIYMDYNMCKLGTNGKLNCVCQNNMQRHIFWIVDIACAALQYLGFLLSCFNVHFAEISIDLSKIRPSLRATVCFICSSGAHSIFSVIMIKRTQPRVQAKSWLCSFHLLSFSPISPYLPQTVIEQLTSSINMWSLFCGLDLDKRNS